MRTFRRRLPPLLAVAVLAAAPARGQDLPKVKVLTNEPAAVTKADRPAAPAWVEIAADPILTVLQAPGSARWVAMDDGCELRPAGDGRTATFGAARPGRYRLLVVPESGEPIRVAVLVGQSPTPPTPDPPRPPEPSVSELGRRLQAAFDGDPLARGQRLRLLSLMIELYQQAATLAGSTEVATTGALLARVKDAARALGLDGMAELRKVIAAELAAVMPTDETLTPDLRRKAAEAFTRITNALKEVK